MTKIKVGLIYGGKSFEHEVSKMTAESVLKNIDKDLYEVVSIYIDKKGKMDERLLQGIDIAFLAVHGPNCEDGKLQSFLEAKGIKYTGSGIIASKLNMDKIGMHEAFKRAELPIVKFIGFGKTHENSEIIKKVEAEIGYPCFIKPNNAGSSIGISRARNIHELRQGILKAYNNDEKIIVEKAVEGVFDVELGILGNDDLLVSEPAKVVHEDDFYTYYAKYNNEKTTIIFDIDPDTCKLIKTMAEKAFKSTGCRGYARVDFFLDQKGTVYINEINTLPGFTATSMYPKLMANSGINYRQLITKIIKLGLE